MKWLKRCLLVLGALLAGPILAVSCGNVNIGQDWRTADRSSAGMAPDPRSERQAVVQVYAARAFNWRGALGVHTWIAAKPRDGDYYTVHQVMGWRALPEPAGGYFDTGHSRSAVVRSPSRAARGFARQAGGGSNSAYRSGRGELPFRPRIQFMAGPQQQYLYRPCGPRGALSSAWICPTPPSARTFSPTEASWRARPAAPADNSPSTVCFGVTVAREEGLELNILALNFGIDLLRPAVKLPGIGRIGMNKLPR